MNKLFRFFMYFMMPVLFGLVLSCKDDEGGTTPTPTPDPDPVEEPTITSVAPGEGEPGDEVVITGTNLEDAEVTFGDFNATVTANTATSITTTVPDDATAGAQNITVTTEGGTATFDFTVTEAVVMPVITSFDPMSGPVGTTVTVTGTDLNLATSAMFGDVAITDWEVNEDGTEATFTVPEGAVTGPFTLMTDAEDEIASEDDFTVEEPTTLFMLEPMYGAEGTTVTLSGADFTGVTSIMFGETEITDVTVEGEGAESTLTFDVPAGATTSLITIGDNMEASEEFAVGTPNTIFGDASGEGWETYGGWGQTSDLANTEVVGEGASSIRVDYTADAWGGFQFGAPWENPYPLTGNESVVLSIYGAEGAGGTDVNVYIKHTTDPSDADKVRLDVVEGEWRTYVIPVSQFGNNPEGLQELVVQNASATTNAIYIDNVMLIE